MASLDRTRALYAELAASLGVPDLVPDENGGVQLTVGEEISVILFGQDDVTLLIVAPIAALPQHPEYAVMLWLFRRNLYDSPLMPFQTACDIDGNLVFWGRVPIEGMSGAGLKDVIDALGAEVTKARGEIGSV